MESFGDNKNDKSNETLQKDKSQDDAKESDKLIEF